MTDSDQRSKDLGTNHVVWDLTDLYESSNNKSFISDRSWCEEEAVKIRNEFRSTIDTLNSAQLGSLVQRLERLDTCLGRLATYSFLNYTTQIDNEKAGALYQDIHELTSKCGKETVFFELEWNQLDEEHVTALLLSRELEKI